MANNSQGSISQDSISSDNYHISNQIPLRVYHFSSESFQFNEAGSFSEVLRDHQLSDKIVLEGYFNDIYKLFIRRLCHYENTTTHDTEERNKLRSLFDEIVKVKSILLDAKNEKDIR